MHVDPIPFRLKPGTPAEVKLRQYLHDRVVSLRLGLAKLHGEAGIIRWRKAYEAIPAESVREFPWHNASNLVVPVIAIHRDTLLARVMSCVFKVRPLWVARELGDFLKTPGAEGMRGAIEDFLGYVGIEPSELDLYRVEEEWHGETINLGTSVLKVPWVKTVEDKLRAAGDASGTGAIWERVTKYEGPRPEKLRFENFKCPVNKGTLAEMDFKYDIIQLDRMDLEERKFRGLYDSAAVDAVLQQPDRTSSTTHVQSQKEQDANVRTVPGYGFAEWDICECHFMYRVDLSHFARLIIWYHEKSDKILRSYYHYYPDEVYLASRLFFRDDMFHGIGFAEMLLPFQEEISEIHNQRRDNMTVANTKMWAVDPDSKLHKGYRTYPGAMLPARQTTGQKEIEPLESGTPVQGEIDSERLSLELAEKRSGVSPPMQGSGAGTNTKRGVYTAMGTLSLLQEGNTRTDLNSTDIRYAHTRLGRLLALEYGSFGVSEDLLRKFGGKAGQIQQALEAIAEGRMALPISAATASVNREVEKQSDLMLTQVMDRYHQGITQMISAINNPMTPEPVKQYVAAAIKAARLLMMDVLRHFDRDEVERLVPKVDETAQPPAQPSTQQPPAKPSQAAQPGQQPVNGSTAPMLGPALVPPSVGEQPPARVM